ncbi:MAG: protein kinase [Caldilineaceae bacterium]|nr:protein kinase [Caldilineaceae bacterium]
MPFPGRKELLSNKPRLWKEFDVLTRLQSPHVVKALDYFMENGCAYLVMEYLTGTDLEARVETIAPLAFSEAEQVARDLCDALGEIHAQGFLHLGIKPSKVMLTASG